MNKMDVFEFDKCIGKSNNFRSACVMLPLSENILLTKPDLNILNIGHCCSIHYLGRIYCPFDELRSGIAQHVNWAASSTGRNIWSRTEFACLWLCNTGLPRSNC